MFFLTCQAIVCANEDIWFQLYFGYLFLKVLKLIFSEIKFIHCFRCTGLKFFKLIWFDLKIPLQAINSLSKPGYFTFLFCIFCFEYRNSFNFDIYLVLKQLFVFYSLV